jgi:integrin beta 3
MPDLDALASQLGAELAAQVQPLIERLKADMEARLAAMAVRAALIDREGELILTFGDGSTRALGKVVGRDGADGRDGKDGANGTDGKDGAPGAPGRDGEAGKNGEPGAPGVGFDDLAATLHDDGRTVVLAFMRGEQVKSFELVLPAMVYRGVYEQDRTYRPGDTVTFGGSAWVANTQTAAKPGEAEKAWTLAVKRGRDGKDFAGPQVKVPS